MKRKENQDDIRKMSYRRVGISLGATWSWGVSMIATMAFMYTYGIIPALVWVLGNILAMPLFGYVKVKIRGFEKWINFIPLILFSLFIAVMAVIMNMQALLIGLGGGHDVASFHFLDNSYSVSSIIFLSLTILLFIYKYGLRGNVLSDLGYYCLQIFAVVLLAVSSVIISNFTINPNSQLITEAGIKWVFPLGLLGIITGVFTDPMMWQRFEQKENQIKLSLWGGFWFGLYMIFVVLTGLFFKPTLFLGILLLIVIFALAVSTIGSAIDAMQYLTKKIGIGKAMGLIIALIAIITWPYLMELGMAKIWNIYAGYRWKVVTGMIVISLLGQYVIKKEYKEKIVSFMKKIKLFCKYE
ncbi:hypothetical protein L6274_05690 [Candidatus Parcubacteria bacterium]|nr:hypothetical protein [Candidatus Parcubacteria bacterium]